MVVRRRGGLGGDLVLGEVVQGIEANLYVPGSPRTMVGRPRFLLLQLWWRRRSNSNSDQGPPRPVSSLFVPYVSVVGVSGEGYEQRGLPIYRQAPDYSTG